MEGEKILRKSPRLTKVRKPMGAVSSTTGRTRNGSSGGSHRLKVADQKVEQQPSRMSEERMLRKSPRLMKSTGPGSFTSNRTGNGSTPESLKLRSADQNAVKQLSIMLEEKSLRKSPRLLKSIVPLSSTLETSQNAGSRKDSRPKSVDAMVEKQPLKKPKVLSPSKKKQSEPDGPCLFVGNPIPMDEARKRWPRRYEETGKGSKGWSNISKDDAEEEFVLGVKYHYSQADIAGCILDLGDCAYVKGEEGKPNYIGRILEFFEATEGQYYFSVQWFFRAGDTVMKKEAAFHDEKRVFYSDLRNDNPLECLVSKVKIVQIAPRVGFQPRTKCIPPCDFYYDMKYSVDYSTFSTIEIENSGESRDFSSSCIEIAQTSGVDIQPCLNCKFDKSDVALLDLYSGCGALSTGLCLGAKCASVNLVTRWAVDFNESACESLRVNHPETQIRNETAEDFLALLKEWEKLCKRYADANAEVMQKCSPRLTRLVDMKIGSHDNMVPPGEYEVFKLVDICYGDPNETGKRGLRFKVRWVGYGPSEDTWELIEGLSKCEDHIQDFVRKGFKSKILPLPGDVNVVCGGPPCQGISGYNRYRNVDAPLDDERNHQIVVFMDIVKFLQPKYVLMENVVDILKFADGSLGRYALSRLVHMNYQARLGIMAAGCYGLPQFRLRVFLWGTHPYEKLPQYPLPTHDVVSRGSVPTEFERNTVAYDEDQHRELENMLLLSDAISELPLVTNDETREQMPYGKSPQTEFQRLIRSVDNDMKSSTFHGVEKTKEPVLYDHRPIQLNEDDYMRVCQIPKRKVGCTRREMIRWRPVSTLFRWRPSLWGHHDGANFRDLPGVVVGDDNIVRWDPTIERVLLPSGKPLVPDYAMSFSGGKSTRPFGRLWWDETVPTVLTTIEPHNQVTIHPEQDRVLTIRECARLQGFPDHYRFCGTVRDRYTQIGNAVAVPVSRALGYAFGVAWLKLGGFQPLLTLPPKFFHSNTP